MAIAGAQANEVSGRRVAPLMTRLTGWHAESIASYRRSLLNEHALAQELVEHVRRLTGRDLELDEQLSDVPNQTAWGSLDGIRVRWCQGQLAIVRPCAHCGRGIFASQPLQTLQDVGRALSGWQPLHHGCQPFVADELF